MPRIVALCGGVGGAKLASGLARVLAPHELAIVVNTGDDFEHMGLAICPDLASDLEPAPRKPAETPVASEGGGFNLPEVERELMIKVLDKTDWNVTKSARLLGLTRDMLRYRIEKLGLARLKHNN